MDNNIIKICKKIKYVVINIYDDIVICGYKTIKMTCLK